MITDVLESNLWNIFIMFSLLQPLFKGKNMLMLKIYQKIFALKVRLWHIKIFVMTQGT